MDFDANIELPPELLYLAKTIGLLDADGGIDTGWFEKPQEKLATILVNDEQREAAIELAELLLGTANQAIDITDLQGQKQWLTLVDHRSETLNTGLYIVIEPEQAIGNDTGVKLSFGARLSLDENDLSLALFAKIPLLIVVADNGSSKAIFLVDKAEQCMEVAASVELKNNISATDAVISLRGACITAKLPLQNPQNNPQAEVQVVIKGLKLSDQKDAIDLAFKDADDLTASRIIDVLLSLLQVQQGISDNLKALLALLGLSNSDNIPALPIEYIAQQGITAISNWFKQIIADADFFEAWYLQLRKFLGDQTASLQGSGTKPDPYLIPLHSGANTWSPNLTLYRETASTGGDLVIHAGARFEHTPQILTSSSVKAFAEIELMSLLLSASPVLKACAELCLQIELSASNSSNDLLDTNVNGRVITINSVFAGLKLDANRQLIPIIEARDVQLAADHYPVIDLSSSDALQTVGNNALSTVMDEILTLFDINSRPEAHAFIVLAGLARPSSLGNTDPWPDLINLADFLQNPLGAIGCYHIRVVNQSGAWIHIAQELALLLNHHGLTSPTITGDGNKQSPWICTLFDNRDSADAVRGQTELKIYTAEDQTSKLSTLYFEQHTQPFIAPIDNKDLTIQHINEFLQMELPSPQICPAPPTFKWIPSQRVRTTLSENITATSDNIVVEVRSIELEILWSESEGLACEVLVVEPRITLLGTLTPFELPDFSLNWLDQLSFDDLDWRGIEALLANWISSQTENAGISWGEKLAELFAWLPNNGNLRVGLPNLPDFNLELPIEDLPRLSLQNVLSDPIKSILDWLKSLFPSSGSNTSDFSLPLLNGLLDFFAKREETGSLLRPQLQGQGTYIDPWAIALSTNIASTSKSPELLLWLDPEGPSLTGISELASHLLPTELRTLLNGTNNTVPDVNQLAQWLERIATLVPELRERLLHSGDLPTLLATLRNQLADGDGIVLASDQHMPDWTSFDMAEEIDQHVTHLTAPALFKLDDYVASSSIPPTQRRIYLIPPIAGVSAWAGQNSASNTIDLREAGLMPAAFDLSHIANSNNNNNSWYIYLPTQADATVYADPSLDAGTDTDENTSDILIEGITAQTQRLQRVIDALSTEKGGDVILIAHSIAGHVARRVATLGDNISHIITLATPHNGSLVSELKSTVKQNSARLLQCLHRFLDNSHTSNSDLDIINDVLDSLSSVLDEYVADENNLLKHIPFPVNDFLAEDLNPVANHVMAINVVTRIAPEVLDKAIAKFIHHVIEQAINLLPGSSNHEAVSHIGFGFRAEINTGSAVVGELKAVSSLRLDLHQIELRDNPTAVRQLPRLQLRTELSRQDGWLVKGIPTIGSPSDPRIRYAVMTLDATYLFDSNKRDINAQLHLYDASAFGLHNDLWKIEELIPNNINTGINALSANNSIPQEVNVLLGRLAASFGDVSSLSSTANQFAKVLEALQIASINAQNQLEFVSEGIRRILISPQAELERLLAENTVTRRKIVNTLSAYLSNTPLTNNPLNSSIEPIDISLGDQFSLQVDLSLTPSIRLKTRSQRPLLLADILSIESEIHLQLGGEKKGQLITDSKLASINESPLFGRPSLRLRTQLEVENNNTLEIVPIQCEFSSSGAVVEGLPSSIAIYPLPDGDALKQWLQYALLGEILRLIFNEVSQPIKPLLKSIGLVKDGIEEQVKNFAGLLANPKAWLSHQQILGSTPDAVTGLQRLDTVRIKALINALQELIGLPITDGVLSLPANAQITVQSAGTAVDLILKLPTLNNSDIEHGSQINLRINEGLQAQFGLSSSLNLKSLPQLEHLGIVLNLPIGTSIPELAIALKPNNSNEVNIGLLPQVSGLQDIAGLATNTAVNLVLPEILGALTQLQDSSLANTMKAFFNALGIRDSVNEQFNIEQLRSLAQDPALYFKSRFLASSSDLFNALDEIANLALPNNSNIVTQSNGNLIIKPLGNTIVEITLTSNVQLQVQVSSLPLASLSAITISGAVVLDQTGLSSGSFAVEVVDSNLFNIDIVPLLPFVSIQGNQLQIGLWLEPNNIETRDSLSLSFTNGTVLSCAGSSEASDCIKAVLNYYVLPLLTELLVSRPEMATWLKKAIPQSNSSIERGEILEKAGILKRANPSLPYHMDKDGLLRNIFDNDFEALSQRVWFTAIKYAETLISREIELDPFKITFAKDTVNSGSANEASVYGLNVNLIEPLRLGGSESQTKIELLINDGTWEQQTDSGITFLGLSIKNSVDSFADLSAQNAINFSPWLKLVGIGLKISDANNPKLIDAVVSVNSIHLDTLYERNFVNASVTPFAGGRITLDNLSIPIGNASGDKANPIAAKLLTPEEGTASTGDAEVLSPTFSPQITLMAQPEPALIMHFLDESDKPIWIPIQQKFGPMYIEQIGLDYTEGDIITGDANSGKETKTVSALLDGGLQLSGLNIGVDDLKLTVPFKNPANVNEWELDLAGLAISYQSSGVNLAGGFRKVINNNLIEYSGLLQVDIAGFGGLTAIGSYGVFPVNNNSDETYTSMFGFASLLAPIGGPPAFFVTGIGGGMGLNRALTIPDMDSVPSYPLVAALDKQSDFAKNPMSALESFGSIFPPSRGKFWFAAGIRFTSFALVESVAVIALEVSDEIEIQLLGLSRMALPTADTALVNIELALRARISTRDQLMSIEARLTDNSWLLSKDCRLTGGFAFVIWFKPEEANFVLTLGGYHPNFSVPELFPTVPRLGFNWTPGGGVTIKGQSYFALTSSCVMAGGRLEISYSQSIVWASFVAGMDMLIAWDPLAYELVIYVQISAGIQIRKCWKPPFFSRICISLRLSFSIGAEVAISGPEMRGTATLDLDVTSVTVRFGATNSPASLQELTWQAFHKKYIAQGDLSEPTMGMGITSGLLIPDAGKDGDLDDGSLDKPFKVQVEFSLETHTRTASKKITFNGVNKGSVPITIGASPMFKANINPINDIRLFKIGANNSSTEVAINDQIVISTSTQKVPKGIWGGTTSNTVKLGAETINALINLHLIAKSKLITDASHPDGVLAKIQKANGEFLVETGPVRPLPFHQERGSNDNFNSVSQLADNIRANTSSIEEALIALSTQTAHISTAASTEILSERAAPPIVSSLAEGIFDKTHSAVQLNNIATTVINEDISTLVGKPKLATILRQAPVIRSSKTLQKTSVKIDRNLVAELAPPELSTIKRRWQDHITTRLDIAAPQLKAKANTVVLEGSLPITGVAMGLRELRRDFSTDTSSISAIISLERNINHNVSINSGDTQVWTLQNAQYDNQAQRPVFITDNKQVMRLVFLDSAGGVLKQHLAKQEDKVAAPVGTQTIAVSALGNQLTLDAYSGWTRESVLQQVHMASYLAPEAIINVLGKGTRRKGHAQDYGLVKANDALKQATAVSTLLPTNINTIAIALDIDGDLDRININDLITLGLKGAIRALDGQARLIPPVIFDKEGRLIALFKVLADENNKGFITVDIAMKETINLAAVIGSNEGLNDLLHQLVSHDIQQLLKPTSTINPVSSSISWADPQ